ncbi:uncharacterized protein LOC124289999 [Haliotis rubra]|uniref:uncharacterized protein LOC124289999 n=1 Tax=Haliotis rubra TaxID=36100 RepID=UPI001EE5BD30|nr:uncharacterized protein LOC124289999 [Haliotis rubra]XP_046582615.1 uncharacterized protein LOC124289999 [Haliotis rubra]XP_046582616.1 uncharacterized protein LOC124289999 [Haliotis rubra]XP_046582617.1 uncharacterized protein LOC124289999 [Haliotis rubra]XP_046582618.1 uncharacterized protein LOC124289999 [Haliotis rubra]XP_046582619.1 uncharacterized protein LOC124289999 [Haliotis rubra]XP_046582620.1 uncharacterized protein LOC124289999 [Haliotis rubra]XP_046582621.1 uncharacterized p
MGLIYGYLLVVTSVLLHTQAHDRRYHGVAYHLRNVTFSGHFLHINGRLVCNEGFSMLDAAVVCRQMGNDSSHVNIMYDGTAKANTSLIGEGCRGSETRLQQCYFGIKSGCRRTIPVSIMCHKGEKQKTNITVLPSNSIRVYNGTTVTVTCLAKGRYMPSEYWYTWTLANTSNVVGSSPSISLRLDEAFRTKKNLTCSVAVRNQTQGNKSIDLQVLGDPPPLEATYDLHVGEILELDKDCKARCNCSLRKVKGHRDQDSFDKIPCNMSITNKSQSGLYIIRRTNYLNVTIGEPRKGISAEVVEIQVSDKPTIECPEQQYVISSGSKRHQMCRFQSPWFIKNCTGDPQASCINCSIHTNEIHNRGNFTCEVGYSNKRLNESNSTTFNIRLHILNANWTVLVMTGSNISLHSPNCSDTNSNNYTWQILSDDGKVSGNHSQLYNVTTSANYVGFSQKMANTLMKLEVLHEPEVTCDQKVSHPLGTRVSLKCSVNAVPGFSYITWTRHGEVIGNTNSDTWDLGDIGMVDKGGYTCTAYNTMVDDCSNETREGNGSCTITLDVYVEGDKRTVTVVASVLSLLLVCLMGVVGVLSGLLHVARREERRGNQPTKMLPLLTTPEPVKGVPPSDIYENA